MNEETKENILLFPGGSPSLSLVAPIHSLFGISSILND